MELSDADSLAEHSNIQLFLIEKFKFRKAYCRLDVHYAWWLKLVVKSIYPFRKYIRRANSKHLDGVEVFNAKSTKEENDNSLKWAEENNIKIHTSGSDCHRETGVGFGGIITEEPIKTNEDLLRILKSGNYKLKRNQK